MEPDFISKVTSMFENCTRLSEIKFIITSLYNITYITSTSKIIHNCPNLKIIDIEGFSTDKTKDISKMFKGCWSLNKTSFIVKLSTKKAGLLNEIFSWSSSFKLLKLSGYDTSNAKNMSGMFKGMSNLEEIELSSFHTEKVEDMSEMYESCILLPILFMVDETGSMGGIIEKVKEEVIYFS